MNKIHRSDRAQVLIIVAIAMMVLFGFMALAVDAGNAYGRRRAAQNASDAAAMAGTRALADGESDSAIRLEAADYAARNYPDLTIDDLEITIDRTGRTVAVAVTTVTDTFFARVIGIDVLPVYGRAKAQYFYSAAETAEGVGSILPMAVQQPEGGFREYDAYDMMNPGKDPGPGMFGWLRFNGCEKNCGSEPALELALTEPLETRAGRNQSCGDCKEDVRYCSPHWCGSPGGDYGPLVPQVGEWISGLTGKVNGDGVRDALKNIILGYNSTRPDEPWPIQNPVVIPFFDEYVGQGSNTEFRIAGFAKFKICCFDLSGNSSYHTCDEGYCAEANGPEEADCMKCVDGCKLSGNDACVCGVFLGTLDSVTDGGGSQRTYRDHVIKLIE
jgi:hypothetical protein